MTNFAQQDLPVEHHLILLQQNCRFVLDQICLIRIQLIIGVKLR